MSGLLRSETLTGSSEEKCLNNQQNISTSESHVYQDTLSATTTSQNVLQSSNLSLLNFCQSSPLDFQNHNVERLTKKSDSNYNYKIHYSVFSRHVAYPNSISKKCMIPKKSQRDAQLSFDSVLNLAIESIQCFGIQPKLASCGSSGCYFLFDPFGKPIAVFKPMDEEPYGPLSPKWTKWLHRNLFPCCFGRACLIPNIGYLCEAAASVLDYKLQTNLVPHTEIVSLSSSSFNYPYIVRRNAELYSHSLPSKIGSLQMFLTDYLPANEFFKKYPLPKNSKSSFTNYLVTEYSDHKYESDNTEPRYFQWSPETIKQFRLELEKLIILDYIMRNTDRSDDNWMIKINFTEDNKPVLKIGAIDSGLSFPWKHPDEWRSFPFGWLYLPLSIIGHPFSQSTRDHFIPLLTSVGWWEDVSSALCDVFSKDKEFKMKMWKKQLAILKGQSFNVLETLLNPNEGPLELATKRQILIKDKLIKVSGGSPVFSIMSSFEDNRTNDSLFSQEADRLQENWSNLLEGHVPDGIFSHHHTNLNYSLTSGQEINDKAQFEKMIVETFEAIKPSNSIFGTCWC